MRWSMLMCVCVRARELFLRALVHARVCVCACTGARVRQPAHLANVERLHAHVLLQHEELVPHPAPLHPPRRGPRSRPPLLRPQRPGPSQHALGQQAEDAQSEQEVQEQAAEMAASSVPHGDARRAC